jgi:hypothetical protein
MADDRHYVPGDFYRICDRTGFKVRAGKTRKEWTGIIVRSDVWEARHPQDFVRGTRDDQRVPDARPRPANKTTRPLLGGGASFEVYGDNPLYRSFYSVNPSGGNNAQLVVLNGAAFITPSSL